MTTPDLRAAAQQALDAISAWQTGSAKHADLLDEAADNLSTALAQPEPTAEPVAWMYTGVRFDDTLHDRPSLIWHPKYVDAMSAFKGVKATPLYAFPPHRKPLTNGEIYTAYITATNQTLRAQDERLALAFARAVERAHGIG